MLEAVAWQAVRDAPCCSALAGMALLCFSAAAHAAPAALLQTASRCFARWLRERAGYAQLID